MTQFESSKHYGLIEKAIRVLEQHANSLVMGGESPEPTLENLANRLHTTPFHLQRTFSAWAGVSPKQFFQCLQKDHARRLLASGKSILETATELGLPSSSKIHPLILKFEALSPGELKDQGQDQTFTVGHAESPFGQAFVCLTSKGLNSLEFATESLTYELWLHEISKLYPKATLVESHPKACALIHQIFHPGNQLPTNFYLHLRGTPFQLQVWQALMHLPAGQLASYQSVATHIGKPSASRAVGSAIAKNPIAFLIPCHRVIQATGELGQYRWQSQRKKALHIWEQGQIRA